jgi:peroxiredoxin Q/BCP
MDQHRADPTRPLDVGDELPDVALVDDRGAPVRLRSVAIDRTTILFFYPKDNGVFCRTQACALRDSWPLLRAASIAVYGVNGGDADGHARFRDRHALPFPLLVDADLALARSFGFVRDWIPGSSPRAVERSTVIVDPGGRIRTVLRNVRASAHFDMLRVDLGLPEADPAA